MRFLLRLSGAVDTLNTWIGRWTMWLVLGAVLISAGNAIVRKSLNMSSNALLEIQWYLFAAVFLLGAGYTLLRNAHVRIDVVSTRLSSRPNAVIDIIGIVLCIVPISLLLAALSWPIAYGALVSGEMSQNAGGLLRWPVYMLLPVAFVLLLMQALSELVKRIAFLTGHLDAPFSTVADPDAAPPGPHEVAQ